MATASACVCAAVGFGLHTTVCCTASIVERLEGQPTALDLLARPSDSRPSVSASPPSERLQLAGRLASLMACGAGPIGTMIRAPSKPRWSQRGPRRGPAQKALSRRPPITMDVASAHRGAPAMAFQFGSRRFAKAANRATVPGRPRSSTTSTSRLARGVARDQAPRTRHPGGQLSCSDHDGHRFPATVTDLVGDRIELACLHGACANTGGRINRQHGRRAPLSSNHARVPGGLSEFFAFPILRKRLCSAKISIACDRGAVSLLLNSAFDVRIALTQVPSCPVGRAGR